MKSSSFLKYFSFTKYRRLILKILNNTLLQNFDMLRAPAYENRFQYPPIFFLGVPRSGSTLIYQVITDAFDVSYLSNRHCQLFGSPALTERLFKPLKNKKISDYTSYHGQTEGWSAPSECGDWWYRFFRREPAYVTLNDVDKMKMKAFRRSLLAFTEASGKPIIFKNLYASLRLNAIAEHIPEALFIIIHRDESDNGHSLLETRYKVFGTYDKWWSMPPPTVDLIKKKPAYAQVIEQIRSLHNIISNDIEKTNIPANRIHHIHYEEFCDNVHNEMKKLEKFFQKNVHIKRFDLNNIPDSFNRRNNVRIDKDIYKDMLEYINEKI